MLPGLHFFIFLLCFFQPMCFILSDWPPPFGLNHSWWWPHTPQLISALFPVLVGKLSRTVLIECALVRCPPLDRRKVACYEWWLPTTSGWTVKSSKLLSKRRNMMMLASQRKEYGAKKTMIPTMAAQWPAVSKPNQQCYELLLNNYVFFLF